MKKILCKLNIHNWEITKWSRFKDRKHCRNILEQGFDRQCEECNKRQRLLRPEKYHPVKYVWTDI